MSNAGLIQVGIVISRSFGTSQTFCKKCGKTETFKIIDGLGSHTYLCGCGCTIYKYCLPDENHDKFYFLKTFVSKSLYNKKFKNMDKIEQLGFKKSVNKNGDVSYATKPL